MASKTRGMFTSCGQGMQYLHPVQYRSMNFWFSCALCWTRPTSSGRQPGSRDAVATFCFKLGHRGHSAQRNRDRWVGQHEAGARARAC